MIMKKFVSLLITVLFLTTVFVVLPVSAEELPAAVPEGMSATPTDLLPEEEPVEAPAGIPDELPEEIPEDLPEMEPEVFLNAIMLRACDLLDAPDGARLAELEAGQSVIILNPGEIWTRIDTGEDIGFVFTRNVALYNENRPTDDTIRSVRMSSSIEGQQLLQEGMPVVLTVTLSGFEGDQYTIQWQYSPDGGTTAIDIPGATGESYGYYLSRENFRYLYRVVIICEDEE